MHKFQPQVAKDQTPSFFMGTSKYPNHTFASLGSQSEKVGNPGIQSQATITETRGSDISPRQELNQLDMVQYRLYHHIG
jgi:hypothetical protein